MDWLVIVDEVIGEGLKAPHSVCGMTWNENIIIIIITFG